MIYAIGDIHGCKNSLEALIEKIPMEKKDTLIFLGDYIDRGPDSKGVVDLLLDLSVKHANTVFLKGNHEWMFERFYDTRGIKAWEIWEYNGARKTLSSYGDIESIPETHVNFLKKTRYYHLQDGYVFVHAGVRPEIPLEEQDPEDLIWIREQFIFYKEPMKGYTVVFGHTPQDNPILSDDKIGIDTGCVYGGSLTCIRVNDKKIFQVRCKG